MWSKVEKTAKEVARNANAAAKMVAENEQFQAVAGKVQEKTKKVSMKINQHLEGKNKSPKNKDELESSRGNTLNSPGRSSSRNRSFRPFAQFFQEPFGEGRAWSHGQWPSEPAQDNIQIFNFVITQMSLYSNSQPHLS